MILLTAKNLAIAFALATTAFFVSTIVLAVQKADLEDELQDVLDKLNIISTLPTAATPSFPTQSTAGPTNPINPTTSTVPTSPTASSTATVTVPTAPVITASTQATSTTQGIVVPTITVTNTPPTSETANPNYPVLPTGLPDPEKIFYRLPTEIRPVKYRIYWEPNFSTNTCEGYVTVQIEIEEPTNLIVMHSKDLEIEGVSILNVMAYLRIRVKSFYLSPERELLIIELWELLRKNTPYVVNIEFTCQLSGLSGMYASVYNNQTNTNR